MTDQAQAVESDPLERMIGILDEEEGLTAAEAGTDEPEDEEQSAEDDSEETTEEPEEWEEIEHNGEIKKLSKTEVKELAQKGFDYTQKTQQIAEERRVVEAERAFVRQQAELQAAFTDHIADAKAIQSQLKQYDEVPWQDWISQIQRLAIEDPMAYQAEHAKFQAAKLQHDSLREQFNAKTQYLSHLQQVSQQQTQEQTTQRLQKEAQAMKQAIPEWKDQERASQEMGELRSFLSSNGFSPAEVDSVLDHRHVVVARKAMLYDKMMSKGKEKVINTPPPVAKPGGKAKPNNDSDKYRDALKKTGKGDYAAKLIERML